jgi:hypothetical protein
VNSKGEICGKKSKQNGRCGRHLTSVDYKHCECGKYYRGNNLSPLCNICSGRIKRRENQQKRKTLFDKMRTFCEMEDLRERFESFLKTQEESSTTPVEEIKKPVEEPIEEIKEVKAITTKFKAETHEDAPAFLNRVKKSLKTKAKK